MVELNEFSTQDAIKYLRMRHGIDIKENTFYQQVGRLNNKPRKIRHRTKHGAGIERYVFTKEELDAMSFRDSILDPRTQYKKREPIEVKSEEELQSIRNSGVPLVDGVELRLLIEKEYNVKVTAQNIKQRRTRRTLIPVAYMLSGKKRRAYWYDARDVSLLQFKDQAESRPFNA